MLSTPLKRSINIGFIGLSLILFNCKGGEKKQEKEEDPVVETVDHAFRSQFFTKEDSSAVYLNPDASVDERIADLLSKMSLEEKCAQMIQGERKNVTADDIEQFGLGSILSGGGSTPGKNSVADWNSMINDYQSGAFKRKLKIPLIYGIDAVHGHANVRGATIFPHNIGLGAANNDSLMFLMGKHTSMEVFSTGMNWNFSPCVALARDPRWGRTYESFSTNHGIITRLGEAYTKGAMSVNMVATAKHFIGDGGTTFGSGLGDKIDRGNTEITMEELRATLLPPYVAQVNQGVQTVMPSYSKINNLKMHAHDTLINGVLKKELGFGGFVISDWQAIEEIPNKTFEEQVVISINAGVDMLMQPEKWKQALELLIKGVNDGNIPQARIDDAVTRILKVKFESGLFEDPILTMNPNKAKSLRSEEAISVATSLAEQSLVLLKNDNALPLKEGTKVFVTGEGANNIGIQCGGWTIEWQGGFDKDGKKYTEGVTILEGLQAAAGAKNIEIITDATRAAEADVVVMVLAEKPYAEMIGDSEDLSLIGTHAHEGNQATMETVKGWGKPVVTVMLAGRQLVDVDDYIGDWNAAVMAYLPGSEGGVAVANLLLGNKNFTGKVPMPWYDNIEDIRKEDAKLLFKVGDGLSY